MAGENPQELQQWLHMFDTCLIEMFQHPVFYSYVSKNYLFRKKN